MTRWAKKEIEFRRNSKIEREESWRECERERENIYEGGDWGGGGRKGTFLLLIAHAERVDGVEGFLNERVSTIDLLDSLWRLVACCAHHT